MRRDVNARFGFYMFDKSCKTSAMRAQAVFQSIMEIITDHPSNSFQTSPLYTTNQNF